MALLKALIAWATHTYLYSTPWIGGFLKSVELVEISNLLVFSILGVGIGAATFLLPRRWDHRAKLAVLFFVTPFVFCASYMVQQHLWIKQVATISNISYRQARDLTNDYLEREVGTRGFFGFYPFSTQLAELPVRPESLSAERSLNPNELLSQELASYDDPRADLAAYWFERVGWLLRFMYMTIAALTALIYYFKGYAWAENKSQANGRPLASDNGRVPAQASISKQSGSKSTASKSSISKPPGSKSSSSKSPGSKPPGSKSPGSKSSSSKSSSAKPAASKLSSSKPPHSKPRSSAMYPDLYPDPPTQSSTAKPKVRRAKPSSKKKLPFSKKSEPKKKSELKKKSEPSKPPIKPASPPKPPEDGK